MHSSNFAGGTVEHIVTGWGRTNNNKFDIGDRFEGGAHSNALLQLKIPFITNEKCRSDFKAFSGITTDKQICAGGLRGMFWGKHICFI